MVSADQVCLPKLGRMTSPRAFLRAALALCMACVATSSQAQDYPSRPIRLVLPFPTGGTFFVGQLLSERLPEALGQPVVIENKPGAGGSLAMEAVAKAAPDGYTLFVTSPTLTITPIVQRNLRFNPMTDLGPVALVATVPNVMVINPKVPARTFREFVELARAQPGKLTYGTGGAGASNHFASEQFKVLAGLDILHIPYQSATHAVTNLVGGQIDMVIGGLPTSAPLVQDGRLRALAVLTRQRHPLLPDVPTVLEVGMPELVVDTWYGVLAPAGTRPEIVERLHREITKIVRSPETLARMNKAGIDPLFSTQAEFAAFVKNDHDKWVRVSRAARLKFD
jgi:tripartite-type tricarboxylate transporter receptor subunit TctC